jgi:hypothetical protein
MQKNGSWARAATSATPAASISTAIAPVARRAAFSSGRGDARRAGDDAQPDAGRGPDRRRGVPPGLRPAFGNLGGGDNVAKHEFRVERSAKAGADQRAHG